MVGWFFKKLKKGRWRELAKLFFFNQLEVNRIFFPDELEDQGEKKSAGKSLEALILGPFQKKKKIIHHPSSIIHHPSSIIHHDHCRKKKTLFLQGRATKKPARSFA